MISTKDYSQLPKPTILRQLCKSIAVLDAIFSPEWELRYHSYNSEWDINEEVFEIQNEEGDHTLILFRTDGCIINGFSNEVSPKSKENLTENLPERFNEFMFGEPVTSIGTTFCLWIVDEGVEWEKGNITDYGDGSENLLEILDGKEKTYIDWASDYFEDLYRGEEINAEAVSLIFRGARLTKEIVLSLVDNVENWDQLAEDLDEIGYPHDIKELSH